MLRASRPPGLVDVERLPKMSPWELPGQRPQQDRQCLDDRICGQWFLIGRDAEVCNVGPLHCTNSKGITALTIVLDDQIHKDHGICQSSQGDMDPVFPFFWMERTLLEQGQTEWTKGLPLNTWLWTTSVDGGMIWMFDDGLCYL